MSEELCFNHNKIHVYMKSECPYCEIDRLKAELGEMNELSKKECREHALFANATGERIGALEGQLAEAKTANLAIRSERNQAVAQLHAELAEARVELERFKRMAEQNGTAAGYAHCVTIIRKKAEELAEGFAHHGKLCCREHIDNLKDAIRKLGVE